MTIEKGQDWGSRALVPADAPIVDTDAGLAELFVIEVSADDEPKLNGPEMVALLPNSAVPSSPRQASDGLARTLGARGTRNAILGAERSLLPIDLGVVTLERDGAKPRHLVMAASLVICRTFWAGVTEGAMNAAFLGSWNVVPSGHPNDGRFDVIRAEMSMADRLKARKRLPSGTHVPHPDVSIRRLKRAEFAPGPNARIWIDGRPYGASTTISLVVIPDAVSIAL